MSAKRGHERLLIPVCIFLVAISFLAHVNYLSRTGFLTGDDMWCDLRAVPVRQHGASEYAAQAFAVAREQGRFQYLFSWSLMLVPYFFDSDLTRGLAIAIVQYLSWISLAWFLAWYTSKTDAWVLLAMICCFVPYLWPFWPIVSYPFYYSTPLILFFGGLGLYLRLQAGRFVKWRSPTLILALAVLFLSLFALENVVLCFACIVGMALWHVSAGISGGIPARFTATVRRDWPVLALVAAYICLYAGFRTLFHSGYAGDTVTRGTITRLGAAWDVLRLFTLTGQPAVSYFIRQDRLAPFWVDHARFAEAVPFVLGNLSLTGLLKSVLIAPAVYLFGRNQTADYAMAGARPSRVIPAAAFVLAFALQAPLAITPKYQEVARSWAPYLNGFLSFLCFAVAGWGIIRLLAKAVDGRSALAGKVLLAVTAAALSVVAALNSISNEAVSRQQERDYAKWRLVNALFQTTAFRELPERAVIVAPTMWDGLYRDSFVGHDRYWSEFILRHTGRNVGLLPEMPKDTRDLIARGLLYYGEIQRTFDDEHALLLMARIVEAEKGPFGADSLSNELAIIGDADRFKDVAVSMAMDASPGVPSFDGETMVGLLSHVRLPAFRPEHGAYVAEIRFPNMVVGSWRLTSAKFQPISKPPVEMVFSAGFSGMETGNGSYWRWSDGASGTGVIDLVNHTTDTRAVRFAVRLRTGRAEPTAFEVTIQGRQERLAVRDRDLLERTLILQPGSNEIRFHSFGPRIAAPGDARHIVFGVESWTVSLAQKAVH